MKERRLRDLLGKIQNLRAAVVGDVCLDAYWYADMNKSELSRETPHHTRPVYKEEYSGGALANVAANLSALGAKKVSVFTILGKDWRSRILIEILKKQGIDTGKIIFDKKRLTPAFIKPILRGFETCQEVERFDFLTPRHPDRKKIGELFLSIEEYIDSFDCVLIGDQVADGVITGDLIDMLSALAERKKHIIFTADSRYRIERFNNMVWKPNEIETIRALGRKEPSEKEDMAIDLYRKGARLVFMTLGEEGCIIAEKNRTTHVRGFKAVPPVDFVGAGDSFHAGIAASLSLGADPEECAVIGNLAASVTVRKVGTTGTANPNEILKIFRESKKGNGD